MNILNIQNEYSNKICITKTVDDNRIAEREGKDRCILDRYACQYPGRMHLHHSDFCTKEKPARDKYKKKRREINIKRKRKRKRKRKEEKREQEKRIKNKEGYLDDPDLLPPFKLQQSWAIL